MGRREEFTVGKLTVTESIVDSFGNIISLGGPAYNIVKADGGIASAGADTTETILVPGISTLYDIAGVGHSVSNDTDNIVSAILSNPIATGGVLTIVADVDPSTAHAYNYFITRYGGIPAFDIVFAGTHTTVGGAAAEAITLAGALVTDLGFACYGATDDTDNVAKVIMTTNTMTVTMSANPLAVHSLHYMVLRPHGRTAPSHYIKFAGRVTTVGGAVAEAFTITGALPGDIPIVGYSVTNDTDTILKSVMTANTLTVTFSADPSTAHAIWYFILRKL